MAQDLAHVNPRDITVADPEEINNVSQDVREATRDAKAATDELDCLEHAIDGFTVANRKYKDKAKNVRKKMEKLSTEL